MFYYQSPRFGRRRILGVAVLLLFCACKRHGPDVSVASLSKPELADRVSQPTPASQPAAVDTPSSPKAIKDNVVAAEIGEATVDVLVAPTSALAAKLKREGAERAEKMALLGKNRIAGHRLASKPWSLSVTSAADLGKLIIAKDSYDPRTRRCANVSWLGVRYQQGAATVEVALGAPCDQLILFWRSATGVKGWGGWVLPAVATSIRTTLRSSAR